MLFLLPDELIGHVLRVWVVLAEACMVDTACCETIKRATLLDIMSGLDSTCCDVGRKNKYLNIRAHQDFSYERAVTVRQNTAGVGKAMSWLISRNATLSLVVVIPDLESNKSMRGGYLAKYGDSVCSLLYPTCVDARQCQTLYEDVLHFCPNITAIEMRHEAPLQMELALKKYGNQLRELHLGTALPRRVWTTLLRTCRHLTSVHFRGPPSEAECGLLARLFLQSPHLECCRFTERQGVPTNNAILVSALAQGCPNLRILEVCPMLGNQEVLVTLATACPNLENALLFASRRVNLNFVISCRNLREVCMLHDLTPRATDAVSDVAGYDVIRFLAELNPLLERLKLVLAMRHRALPPSALDPSLAALGRCCANLQHLRICSLTFHCCPFSDAGVVALAEGCTQLRSAYLTNCTHLTSVAVSALLKHCRQLRVLEIEHCPKVCDAALYSLCAATASRDCPLLAVALQGTFSACAVWAVVQRSRSLVSLEVGNMVLSPPTSGDTSVLRSAHDVGPGPPRDQNAHIRWDTCGLCDCVCSDLSEYGHSNHAAEAVGKLQAAVRERRIYLAWCRYMCRTSGM
jgi:hypothetical protein